MVKLKDYFREYGHLVLQSGQTGRYLEPFYPYQTEYGKNREG